MFQNDSEIPTKRSNTVRLRNVTQGTAFSVNCNVQARQRAIIKAGGLLNLTRTVI
jgi:hypothetical protein